MRHKIVTCFLIRDESGSLSSIPAFFQRQGEGAACTFPSFSVNPHQSSYIPHIWLEWLVDFCCERTSIRCWLQYPSDLILVLNVVTIKTASVEKVLYRNIKKSEDIGNDCVG